MIHAVVLCAALMFYVLPDLSQNRPVLGIQQSLRVLKDASGKVMVSGLRSGQLMHVFVID